MFLFICVFFYTLTVFLSHVYALKAQGGCGGVATTTTSPNDMSAIVWALGALFFFKKFSHVLLFIFATMQHLPTPKKAQKIPMQAHNGQSSPPTTLNHLF
jgi:hypothetical protein